MLIDDLINLKEKGMSNRKIAEYITNNGEQISYETVRTRINDYYRKKGIPKPKIELNPKIELTEEEMLEIIKLKENGVSDRNIAQYLTQKGKKVSYSTIQKRLLEYYESEGKIKPDNRKIIGNKISIEKIIELKEQGITDNKIAEYFTNQGIQVTGAAINQALLKYYKSEGRAKPRGKRQQKDKIKELKTYENDLKQILMTGITIKEYMSTKYNEVPGEEIIRKKIEKLRIIAKYSKREKSKWIPDDDFLEVIDLIEHPSNKLNDYAEYINLYTSNGICKKGKIDLIKKEIFNNNPDLTMFIILRLNLEYHKGYDVRVFEILKKAYEEKIDKYIERLNSIENNRRKNKNYTVKYEER